MHSGCCLCIWCSSLFYFFFKQKTAYEMRISDWSSDVCSSDLRRSPVVRADAGGKRARRIAAADAACVLYGAERSAHARHGRRDPQPSAGRRSRGGRSEERRVGKEGVSTWRSRWLPAHSKKKKTQKRS